MPNNFNTSPATNLGVEDHLNRLRSKSDNQAYQPFKAKLHSRANHSAFGDFPKEHLNNKLAKVEKTDNFDITIAGSASNIFMKKGQGSGGQTSSKMLQKEQN